MVLFSFPEVGMSAGRPRSFGGPGFHLPRDNGSDNNDDGDGHGRRIARVGSPIPQQPFRLGHRGFDDRDPRKLARRPKQHPTENATDVLSKATGAVNENTLRPPLIPDNNLEMEEPVVPLTINPTLIWPRRRTRTSGLPNRTVHPDPPQLDQPEVALRTKDLAKKNVQGNEPDVKLESQKILPNKEEKIPENCTTDSASALDTSEASKDGSEPPLVSKGDTPDPTPETSSLPSDTNNWPQSTPESWFQIRRNDTLQRFEYVHAPYWNAALPLPLDGVARADREQAIAALQLAQTLSPARSVIEDEPHLGRRRQTVDGLGVLLGIDHEEQYSEELAPEEIGVIRSQTGKVVGKFRAFLHGGRFGEPLEEPMKDFAPLQSGLMPRF
jgi:hypothetical protein